LHAVRFLCTRRLAEPSYAFSLARTTSTRSCEVDRPWKGKEDEPDAGGERRENPVDVLDGSARS